MKTWILLFLLMTGIATSCQKDEMSDAEMAIQQIKDFGATKADIYSSTQNFTNVPFSFEGVFCVILDENNDYYFPMANLLHVAYRWNQKHVILYFK